jgi:hypothetical protein
MTDTTQCNAPLALLEKAAAHLRSAGRSIDLGIDADTGSIRIFVDGTELSDREVWWALQIEVGDLPQTEIAPHVLH